MMRRGSATFMLVCLLTLAGCVGRAYEPGRPVRAPELADRLRAVRRQMLPRSLRVTQRAMVEVRGRELVLTELVHLTADGRIQLAAMTDFGKVVFAASRDESGQTRLRRDAFGLGERLLVDGFLRDAEVVWAREPMDNATVAVRADGSGSLVQPKGNGLRAVWRFDPEASRLIGYDLVDGERCVYEVEFREYGLVEGFAQPVPKVVKVRDYRLGYRARIDVASLRRLARDSGEVDQ